MPVLATLAPLLLMLPVAAPLDPRVAASRRRDAAAALFARRVQPAALPDPLPGPLIPDSADQVRIEQRVIIRIVPRAARFPPELLLPPDPPEPRIVERDIGKCLAASRIFTLAPGSGRRLLLYLRDQRVISMTLERACRAREFYSGFYYDRTDDGKLCVDRDALLSRSGVRCKFTRIRELVEGDF